MWFLTPKQSFVELNFETNFKNCFICYLVRSRRKTVKVPKDLHTVAHGKIARKSIITRRNNGGKNPEVSARGLTIVSPKYESKIFVPFQCDGSADGTSVRNALLH